MSLLMSCSGQKVAPTCAAMGSVGKYPPHVITPLHLIVNYKNTKHPLIK